MTDKLPRIEHEVAEAMEHFRETLTNTYPTATSFNTFSDEVMHLTRGWLEIQLEMGMRQYAKNRELARIAVSGAQRG